MPFSNGYSYRRAVTVDRSKIPTVASLTDFAALFSGTYAYLATTGNGGKVEHTSGYDIRFELSDGTKLDHEVESWSATTGAVNLWVRIPTVAGAGSGADTAIYIYYGKSGLSATEANPTGVWVSRFRLVAHLKESPSDAAPEFKDSTANANHGTESGTMVQLAAAKIGAGLTVTSGTSAHGTAASLQITNAFSVSFWFKHADANASKYVIHRGNQWAILFGYVADKFEFFADGSVTGDNPRPGSQITLSSSDTTNWHHLAYTYDGATLRGYLDGVEIISPAKVFSLANTGVATAISPVGARPAMAMDEVRIENAGVSGSEITARYNNQNAPSTFYAVGSEEVSSQTLSGVSGIQSSEAFGSGGTISRSAAALFAEALSEHLLGYAGLAALVGTRCRLGRAFQGTARPFVVYQSLMDDQPQSHTTTDLVQIREEWQFNVYASDPASCRAVKNQIRKALEAFPGSTGYAGVRFLVEAGPEGYVGEPPAEYEATVFGTTWHPED